MAIKGISQEVSDALSFDPFEALGEASSGTRENSSQDNRSQQADDTGQDARPAGGTGDRAPQRDPETGKYTSRPARQPQEEAAPTNKGPAAQPGPDENPVSQFLAQLQKQMPGVGPVAPVPGALPIQVQQQQPAQPQRQQPQNGPDPFDYTQPFQPQDVTLPPDLIQAIFNENPQIAAQGLNTMVNVMYNGLRQEMYTRMVHAFATLPQMITGQVEGNSYKSRIQEKTYGRYPELNDQIGRQTVQACATQAVNAYRAIGQIPDMLSDDFIDYVASQAATILGRQTKFKRPTQQQQRPQERRKQFQTGGGERRGVSSSGGDPFMEALGMSRAN
jgi:hypothetical protein